MVGIVGLVIVANVTLRYLDPNGGENSQSNVSSRVTAIFQSTEQRSNEGGSAFKTINTSSVTSWPYAIVRTLTRPMLFEANGLATLLPALEMAFFMVVGLFSWRRVAHVMVLWRRSPYVTFVLVVLFMFGVAFASIGNLGILTRQRSLVVPLLLLPLCLPLRVARVRRPVQQMPHVRDRVVVGAS